jgi:hypothetical protein
MDSAITVELVNEAPDRRPPEPAVAALAPQPEREAARPEPTRPRLQPKPAPPPVVEPEPAPEPVPEPEPVVEPEPEPVPAREPVRAEPPPVPEPEPEPVTDPQPAPEPEPAPKLTETKPAPPEPEPAPQPEPKIAHTETKPPPPPATPRPRPAPEAPVKPAPEQQAALPPKPEVKPEPPKVAKPEPPKAAKPKPPAPERPEPEPPEQDEFAALLRSVEKMDRQRESEVAKEGIGRSLEAAGQARTTVGDGQITQGERDALYRQITRNWILPMAVEDIQDIIVQLRIEVGPDRSVRRAVIQDQARLERDPTFRAVAESAYRAVERSSPLQLPPDKYAVWQELLLNFSPKDVISG